jgi:hypothetical protein
VLRLCALELQDVDEYYASEDGSYRDRKNKFGWDSANYKDPAELDATASAAEVVQAWAFRLKGEPVRSTAKLLPTCNLCVGNRHSSSASGNVAEIYDQCNPTNALDYEDPDSFMLPPNSPNVRLTTMTHARGGANKRGATSPDKRSALLGEVEAESSPAAAPSRAQSDQYFRLVPSSSSVNGAGAGNMGGPAGGLASGAASVQSGFGASSDAATQPNRGGPRRPPPPTAANTTRLADLESPQSAKASRWPPVSGSLRTIDWREEMKRFYIAIGMPEKIAGINTILSTWAGKEEEMLSSLMEKYRTLIPTQLSNHLEQLLSHLENHTESSFVKPTAGSSPGVAQPSLPRSAQRKASARGATGTFRSEY